MSRCGHRCGAIHSTRPVVGPCEPKQTVSAGVRRSRAVPLPAFDAAGLNGLREAIRGYEASPTRVAKDPTTAFPSRIVLHPDHENQVARRDYPERDTGRP